MKITGTTGTLLIIFTSFIFSKIVLAKKFSNHLVEFDLPIGWECEQRQEDWFCQHGQIKLQREAIIVVHSKKREGQDTLENYKKHLQRGRSYRIDIKGQEDKSYISKSKFVRTKIINQHNWIDALHLGSEVPGFYTRYMATVKGESAIAVTFTVAKDKYQNYMGLFQNSLSSLRFFKQTNTSPLTINSSLQTQKSLDFFIPNEKPSQDKQMIKKKSKGGSFLIILLIFTGLGFYFYRKKKKATTSSSSSSYNK